MTTRPPGWLGPLLALYGLTGILLAGAWPVVDERLLKMSCYWALRAALPLQSAIVCCGLTAMLATSRDGARAAARQALAGAGLLVLTLHVIIPVMPHNVPHRLPQDLLAALTALTAGAGLVACREERGVDAALDALAAAAEQPRS